MGAVAKIDTDFALKINEKSNSQIAGYDKDKINNLIRPIYDHNSVYQNSKARREATFKIIIKSKWGTKRANYICQYNLSKKYAKKLNIPIYVSLKSKPVNILENLLSYT